jgi:hypothetical protein
VRIPRTLLPHRIDIAPWVGTRTEGGSTYGPATTGVRCRISLRRRKVRTADGNSTTTIAEALVSVDVTADTNALVTVRRGPRQLIGLPLKVAEVAGAPGVYSDAGATLMLEGPR